MLTKNQWQWLADHHHKVREFCFLGIVLVVALYFVMIGKMMLDKGKSETPWRQELRFWNQFNCEVKVKSNGVNTPRTDLPVINDANAWLLEWHKTYVYDAEWYLNNAPECFGSVLADEVNDPNPFVIILYDAKTQKPIYRIARIDDVVRK